MLKNDPNLVSVPEFDVYVDKRNYTIWQRNRRRKPQPDEELTLAKITVTTCGYPKINCYCYGEHKLVGVYRIIATRFVERDDMFFDEVDHLDGNPFNNSPSNLRWTTASANRARTCRTKNLSELDDDEREKVLRKREYARERRKRPDVLAKKRAADAEYRRNQYYENLPLRKQQAAELNAEMQKLAELAAK